MKADTIDINYEIHGHGPAILLIHGLGNDLRMWAPLVELMAAGYTLIACDMRGSGRSPGPAGPYSIEAMASDAAGLLEKLGVSPAAILGFSMGGCVALALGLARPELVNRLVLVSALPAWQGPYPPSQAVKALFHRTDVSDELLVAVYETIFGSEYRRRVTAKEYVAERMNDQLPQAVDCYLAQLAALESFDVQDRVKSIRAETLIVAGSDDKVVPPLNSRWLADNMPDARLEMIKGAGHMLPLEKPKELAGLCGSLLKGVE